jgi:hypothetical protein
LTYSLPTVGFTVSTFTSVALISGYFDICGGGLDTTVAVFFSE